MLPRDRFDTTSSKYRTNSGSGTKTSVQYVKGVGPYIGGILRNRGINTVRDLLFFFPRAYEDRSKFFRINELEVNNKATIAAQVLSIRRIPARQPGRYFLDVRCGDTSGSITLKWFNVPRGLECRLKLGSQIIATGTVKSYMGRPEMAHPELSSGLIDPEQPNVGRVVPVYTEIDGIPSRTIRKILWEALRKYASELEDDIPVDYIQAHRLPPISESVKKIHFPDENGQDAINALVNFNTPFHHRLIYEEFFKFEYLILRQRLRIEKEHSTAFEILKSRQSALEAENGLPFMLTEGQRKTVTEILSDISLPHPMNRLVQGDVGCGKTAVAFIATGCVLSAGGQATLMAPTEILAEQHYKNALEFFSKTLSFSVELLTGKTSQSERSRIQSSLARGVPMLLIGTHALLEDVVVFQKLDLVIIDEQHRFGVEQRRKLRQKGGRLDTVSSRMFYPHTLVISATPIPRTLALTVYGDLSVSSIHELPAGRPPITTMVASNRAEKIQAYNKIREELVAGHQAYFIYPLITDSDVDGFKQLKSVMAEAKRLEEDVFQEFKVGLLHGQLKPDQKSSIMEDFKHKLIHILVSTTVVEVGVDIPNATVIVIENAERFGLSQLHQLRGRVGRGILQSYCFLFADSTTGEVAAHRLGVLEKIADGFEIAEADLKIRGPGEFLGTKQSGDWPFKIADLVRDREWLIKARNDALKVLKDDEELQKVEHYNLRRYYQNDGALHLDRFKTS
ncbi:MAG: ATP-dependent DNA helicase RecG [Bdellovibrionota bacterium]